MPATINRLKFRLTERLQIYDILIVLINLIQARAKFLSNLTKKLAYPSH